MSDLTRPTLAAFRRVLLADGLAVGLTWGLAVAAVAVFLVRAFVYPAPEELPTVLCAAPLGAAVGALLFLRRTPSEAKALALTEDATRAGGLILVRGLPGGERWAVPEPVAPPVGWRFRRRLAPLALAALAAFAALSAPASWFAVATSAPPAAFPDVTAAVKGELEDLREAAQLPDEDLAELAEEIERIEAAADPAEPAATLDAVERVEARIAALLDLDGENARRLTDDRAELAALASAPDAAKALSEMLRQAPSSADPTEGSELVRCDDCDGCEDGNEGPGKGGVGRGRDDAPIAYGEETRLGDSLYRDEARKADPNRPTDGEKVGESISGEDPARNAPHRGGYGSTAFGGVSSGASINRTVSPRHRGTVRRFFETERNNR